MLCYKWFISECHKSVEKREDFHHLLKFFGRSQLPITIVVTAYLKTYFVLRNEERVFVSLYTGEVGNFGKIRGIIFFSIM